MQEVSTEIEFPQYILKNLVDKYSRAYAGIRKSATRPVKSCK